MCPIMEIAQRKAQWLAGEEEQMSLSLQRLAAKWLQVIRERNKRKLALL